LPPSTGEEAARFGGPPVALRLLRRRALPAVVGRSVPAPTRLRTPGGGTPEPTRPNRHNRLLVLSAILLTGLLTSSSAQAEEVFTGQAAAARATDSTWIPAPAQRAAVCIVDTGNGTTGVTNPDLSNVVARFATDGGTTDDLHHDHHGTLMSMIASAPYNQFGMVGAAPSINVVSVRASRDGLSFGGGDLLMALQTCVTYASTYNIKVISLSLGGQVPDATSGQALQIQDIVDRAKRAGIDVVAAAGNHPGAVDWPAGYGPVLAVGAADSAGVMCSFAASGPEVDLWASGCPQDVALPDGRGAWAQGSSESTAFVAGVLTQMRGLRPDLSVSAAENLLTGNHHATAAGPSLDVDAAFRAAGLTAQLAIGHAAIPDSNTRPSAESPPASTPGSPGARQEGSPAAVAEVGIPPQPPVVVASRSRARLSKPVVRSVRLSHGLLRQLDAP
jgi:hypothetical protein